MKKYLYLFLLIFYLFFIKYEVFADKSSTDAGMESVSYKTKRIKVIKDSGREEYADLILIGGMGYLSLKDIEKIYNADVKWFPVSKRVTLRLGSGAVQFSMGSSTVLVNGVQRTMNKSVKLLGGDVFIPLEFFVTRSFAEVADAFTSWDYSGLVLRVERLADVSSPAHFTFSDKTRIVTEFRNKKEIDVKRVTEDRIIFKIYRSKLCDPAGKITVNDDVVENIDVFERAGDTIFEINLGTYAGSYEVYVLTSPFAGVVDIERVSKAESGSKSFTAALAPPVTSFFMKSEASIPKVPVLPASSKKKTKKTYSSKKRAVRKKIKRIVIDPGHGGTDVGAVGMRGTKEKDINLIVARRLESLLKKEGYTVFMTRSDDSFVPLSERTRMANRVMADMFISIHCNASLKTKAKGFEVYFLSEKASDKAADAVANLENSVIALEKPPAGNAGDVEHMLFSMAVCEFMNESSKLCGLISKEIDAKLASLTNRGVRQANFCVLRGASMPAILVELAYISNPAEERMLKTKKFQRRAAEIILNGIKKYEKKFVR